MSEVKKCTVCLESKLLSCFSPDKRRKSGLQACCKSCNNIANKKRYHSSKEVRSKKKLYDVDYVNNNRDKKYKDNKSWRNKNKEKCYAMSKRWKQANAHKVTYYTRKRQAAKAKASPNWLNKSQLKEIENFYWLAKDLEKITGEKYHVDHIVPLQGKNVCGLHVPWNLQVLPSDINIIKGINYV